VHQATEERDPLPGIIVSGSALQGEGGTRGTWFRVRTESASMSLWALTNGPCRPSAYSGPLRRMKWLGLMG